MGGRGSAPGISCSAVSYSCLGLYESWTKDQKMRGGRRRRRRTTTTTTTTTKTRLLRKEIFSLIQRLRLWCVGCQHDHQREAAKICFLISESPSRSFRSDSVLRFQINVRHDLVSLLCFFRHVDQPRGLDFLGVDARVLYFLRFFICAFATVTQKTHPHQAGKAHDA